MGDVVDKFDSNALSLSVSDAWYNDTVTDAAWFDRNQWNNNVNKNLDKSLYTSQTFNYSGATVGDPIYFVTWNDANSGMPKRLTGVSGDIEESVGDFNQSVNYSGTNGLPTITDGTYAIKRVTPTATSGSFTFTSNNASIYFYGFDGQTPVTVVSINQSSPEMTVSGGTWTEGETVKNTVARYPSITPTSDEVVGVSQISAWDQSKVWSEYGTKSGIPYSSDYDFDKLFNGVLTGAGPQSQNSDWYTLTFTQSINDVTSIRLYSDAPQSTVLSSPLFN